MMYFKGGKGMKWLKEKIDHSKIARDHVIHLRWYPGRRGSSKSDFNNIRPEELPPLMVKKPAWRK